MRNPAYRMRMLFYFAGCLGRMFFCAADYLCCFSLLLVVVVQPVVREKEAMRQSITYRLPLSDN